MADIHIHREHHLGLAKARTVARAWADKVQGQFDMQCVVQEGDATDTVQFKRSGVSGTLVVAADHFDLSAQLGFLLGAFSKTIQAEIEKNLDALLAGGAPEPEKPTPGPRSSGAARSGGKKAPAGAAKR